jgi:hypothetical protein
MTRDLQPLVLAVAVSLAALYPGYSSAQPPYYPPAQPPYSLPDQPPDGVLQEAVNEGVRLSTAAQDLQSAAQRLPSRRQPAQLLSAVQNLRSRVDALREVLDDEVRGAGGDPSRAQRRLRRVGESLQTVRASTARLYPEDQDFLARRLRQLERAYDRVARDLGR